MSIDITELPFHARIVFPPEKLSRRVEELAGDIYTYLTNHGIYRLNVVTPLKTGIPFTVDLIANLPLRVTLDFVVFDRLLDNGISELRLRKDISLPLNEKVVLFVDTIIRTGRAIEFLGEYLRLRGAKKVIFCTLLWAPTEYTRVIPEFWGFMIEEYGHLVGYGLDWNGLYRNLPYIVEVI